MFSPTHHVEARSAQVLDRFEEGLVAPVQAMIARERDDIESRARQRIRAGWLCHHGVPRLGQARAMGGEAGLQLAEHQLRAIEQTARGGEAFVGMLAIGRQVAGGQHHACH